MPRLTAEQKEAMELIDQLANEPGVPCSPMMFEPGDLQLLNNHTCFHSRTAFEDYPEHDRRAISCACGSRCRTAGRLSPLMHVIYQDQRPGVVRGGFPSRTGRHIYELTGEMVD